MIAYMGYVAAARDDALFSHERVEVLAQLFDFYIAPWFDSALSALGEGVRTTVMESMVYFSSSIALFSQFLTIDFGDKGYGALTFPFLFRQIEPITGLSVIGTLNNKIDLMRSAGVMANGWTTGISSYMLDFGYAGAALCLLLQGYYSAFAWRRALNGINFFDGVVAMVVLASAVYMPLLLATSDTNLFFIWVFCLYALWRQSNVNRVGTGRALAK
jgi:hypothetical protein